MRTQVVMDKRCCANALAMQSIRAEESIEFKKVKPAIDFRDIETSMVDLQGMDHLFNKCDSLRGNPRGVDVPTTGNIGVKPLVRPTSPIGADHLSADDNHTQIPVDGKILLHV